MNGPDYVGQVEAMMRWTVQWAQRNPGPPLRFRLGPRDVMIIAVLGDLHKRLGRDARSLAFLAALVSAFPSVTLVMFGAMCETLSLDVVRVGLGELAIAATVMRAPPGADKPS